MRFMFGGKILGGWLEAAEGDPFEGGNEKIKYNKILFIKQRCEL